MLQPVISNLVRELRLIKADLYTHHEGAYYPVRIKDFPSRRLFQFNQGPGVIEWEYIGGDTHNEEEHLSQASLQVTKQSVTHRDMESMRHDLVCSLLFGNQTTDVALSNICKLGQPSDDLTPDMIWSQEECHIVVEVGTTAGVSIKSVESTFEEKLNKYSGYLVLMAREVRKPIIFIVIAIGTQGIYTNIGLPHFLQEQIMYRMKLGLRFEREYAASGLQRVINMDERPDIANLRVSLAKFSEEGYDVEEFGFDRNTYNDWSNFRADATYMERMEATIRDTTLKEFIHLKETDLAETIRISFEKTDKKMVEGGGARNDPKAPIQVPLVVPERMEGSSPSCHPVENDLNDPILELWSLAVDSAIVNNENFQDNDLDSEVLEALSDRKIERDPRKYHRVNVKGLSIESKAYLAFDGFHAKKYKDTSFLTERRNHSQNSFSPACDVSDIEEVFNYVPDISFMNDLFPSWETTIKLLEFANELQSNSHIGLEQVKSLCDNELFVGLWTISTLAAELAVSQRQNCKPNEMIYKRLRGLAYEILIYPTNSNSHIFFCIRTRGRQVFSSENNTFRRMEYHDGWYYSQLLSVNSSRLENWVKAPTTWLNSFIHWRIWADKCKKEELSDSLFEATNASRLSMMTLMMSLEDKAATEEMITAVRYISMNFFKGNDSNSPPDLAGPITKLPTVLRSRFGVWVYNKIKQYCLLQSINLPVFDLKNMRTLQEDRNGDKWDNLLCPFINVTVEQCQTVIQTFYIGYAKNKEAESYANADYSLIKKILDNVLNKDETKGDIYSGKQEPPPETIPGPHEFSKNALKDACDLAKIRLTGEIGENYKAKLYDQVLKETVERGNYETMATLKASYSFDSETAKELNLLLEHEQKATNIINKSMNADLQRLLDVARDGRYYVMTPIERMAVNRKIIELRQEINLIKKIHSKSSNSKSCKCHEAVILAMEDLNTEGCVPLTAISKIYNSLVSSWGGICCYLFKKNQHGGLREIYVLTFYSRLVQLLAEITGRVLCSHFPEEVMTHPTEKIDAVHRHYSDVKKKETNNNYSAITRCSSEDKSKWSQNNNVSAYSFIATQMLPKPLAICLMKIFRLWKHKKIRLPAGVLSLLEQDIPKDDPAYEQLRNDFWGRGDVKLLDKPGGSYLIADTGMWQGILHYFSSFQHILQTLHYKRFILNTFGIMMQRQGAQDIHITTLVSSDDSLTMMSVLVDESTATDKRKMYVIDRYLSLALMSEKSHSAYFMMIESVKSCMASTTVFEFNSVFHVGQGSISPAVKKVVCCTNIIQSESFETKGRVVYNSIKDIVEEGCSTHQAHLHQLVCGLLHYQAIGMTTTQLFPIWANELLQGQPDPNLGFYLLDKDLLCGVMGYDFMKYESLKLTSVPILASNPKLIQQGLEGNFRTAVLFLHGSRKRWDRLKERVLIPGWEDEIDERPEILFKAYAENSHEARLRLCMKACTKGVYEALSNGGRLASTLATSVFLMRDRVMTIRSVDYEDSTGLGEGDRDKVSLLKLATDQVMASKDTNIITHATMSQAQADLFYTNHEMYERVAKTVEIVRTHGLEVECTAFRKCRNHVVLRTIKANSKVSLMVCCRKIWFGMKVRSNRTLIEDSWKYYKTQFHWLKDTLQETLASGFFSKVTDIYRFLQSLQDTSSTLHILCKRLASSQSAGKINEIIQNNHYPGLKLIIGSKGNTEMREVTDETPGHSKEFQSMLNLMLLHPKPLSDKIEVLKELIQEHDFRFDQRSLVGLNPVESRQLILLAHLSDVEDQEVLRLLRISGGQVLKYFVIEQQIRGRKYGGYGCLAIAHKDFHCEIHLWDDMIIHISTTNLSELRLSWDSILDEVRDANLVLRPAPSMLDYINKAKNQKRSLSEHFDLLLEQSSGFWMMEHGLADKYKNVGNMAFPEITVLQVSQMIGDTSHLTLSIQAHSDTLVRMIASSPNGQYTVIAKFFPLKSTGPSELLSELWRDRVDNEDDLQCWLMNCPRALNGLSMELVSLKFAYDASISATQDRMVQFHREGLTKRLLYKGYLMPTRVMSELPEVIIDDQVMTTEDEIARAQDVMDDTTAIMASVMERESVVNLPSTSRTMDWVEKVESKIGEDLLTEETTTTLRALEERLNEVIQPPVQMESPQSYAFWLHAYWDELINELRQTGILEAFSQEKVLNISDEYTCELISWILNKPCLATFRPSLFRRE